MAINFFKIVIFGLNGILWKQDFQFDVSRSEEPEYKTEAIKTENKISSSCDDFTMRAFI